MKIVMATLQSNKQCVVTPGLGEAGCYGDRGWPHTDLYSWLAGCRVTYVYARVSLYVD